LFKGTKKFFTDLVGFLKNTAEDPRIPERDKLVLLALVALVISPIDLIPDWIPIIGVLDDLVMIGIILDYFFDVLDAEVLLSHYPWGMKSFTWIRRYARMIGMLTPNFVKRRLWKYTKGPYQG